MDTSPPADEPGTARCARCGARFACGALAGAASCWCMQLTKLPPEPGLDGCLCPACLQARIEAARDGGQAR